MSRVEPHRMPFAFVDLETTGTSATADRITEVGIVLMDEDGVEEWSSLVNPGTRISEFIESLTGISNEMVAAAPSFAELAPQIHARLAQRVFVAHNARFDHGFLKNEFKRIGLEFAPDVLCTVKLSRKLFPGHSHHNLDALIERHHLQVTERHRALGDARLIWQFWQTVRTTVDATELATTVRTLIARPSLPPHLDAEQIQALPETHGVYLFYGENDLPLYVGKANNLRRRVMSHFIGDHLSSKGMSLSQQVKRIVHHNCAGELGALLKEAALIRQLAPLHNELLRDTQQTCAWRVLPTATGATQPRLAYYDDLFFGRDDTLYGPYTSARQATAALRALADANGLCPVLLGLEKGRAGKACFASQVQRCVGACCGRESLAEHGARLLAVLAQVRLAAWPYGGPIAIREGAQHHLIDGWAYLGTAENEAGIADVLASNRPSFERDTYVLLQKRLPAMRDHIKALSLTPSAATSSDNLAAA